MAKSKVNMAIARILRTTEAKSRFRDEASTRRDHHDGGRFVRILIGEL